MFLSFVENEVDEPDEPDELVKQEPAEEAGEECTTYTLRINGQTRIVDIYGNHV